MELIIDIFGSLTEEEINSIPKEKFRKFLKSIPGKTAKSLPTLFPKANPLGIIFKLSKMSHFLALDLLEKLMVFDHTKRMTVEEALAHPYLAALHFPDDEGIYKLISKP